MRRRRMLRLEGRSMDLRDGRTYVSREAARAAGVPDSDVAQVLPAQPPGFIPQIHVTKGPFKGRVYVRNAIGQLERVDRPRRGGR